MTVPNELIGCIIGKGGSKIAEIRYEYCMKSDICILHVVVSRPWLSLKTEVILVHELSWAKRFSRLTNFKNNGGSMYHLLFLYSFLNINRILACNISYTTDFSN